MWTIQPREARCELNSGTFRGTVSAEAIVASGNLTADNTTITYASGSGLIIDRQAAGANNLDFARNGTLEAFIGLNASNDLVLEAQGDSVILGASGDDLGFYGAAGALKGTITGSRDGNFALQQLLSYLAVRGLLTDNSVA